MKILPALALALVATLSPLVGAETSAPTDAGRNPESPLRFEVTFPASVRATAATGRVLLFLSQDESAEPRRASFARLGPVYAIDVKELKPGEPVVFAPAAFTAPEALAFPTALGRLPPGAYRAQVVFDLDATVRNYNDGPGNLYSQPLRCELRGALGGTYALVADRVVAPTPPVDTDWVKLVDFPSQRLSAFHGRATHLRAGVILPSTYATEPERRYPVIYVIPGFSARHTSAWTWMNNAAGQRWRHGNVALQAIRVVLDPDTRYGHSVFANSENNGPVGDALVSEMIPEIERRFRAIPAAGARFVTGHSSGGWASLWLQITYPDVFGGCWSTAPDPVDFRAFQTMNLYTDRNGFWTPHGEARGLMRSRVKVETTYPAVHLWEHVTGYGGQLDSFDAVFSPRGKDGRPLRVMDKLSGVIDPAVVEYWKRYDIRLTLEKNARKLRPKLRDKLHVIMGTWDTHYLNPAAELLRDFLKTANYGGYVEMVPGDHANAITPAIARRIEDEMAAAFAKHEARR